MRIRPASGNPIRLGECLPDAHFVGAGDVRVGACWCDPRRAGPGSAVVVLPGSKASELNLVRQAAERGCEVIISQKHLPDAPLPVCLVDDARDAFGRLCQALAGDPSRQLKVIGVSGADGTTSTSCLVASILTTAGYRVGVLGALGCVDGRRVTHPNQTLPRADELAGLLARMAANGCSHAVLELTDEALDERRIAGVRLDAVAVLDHRHDGSSRGPLLRDYLAADTLTVVDADQADTAESLALINGPVLTVGIRSTAEITARVLEQNQNEQLAIVAAGSEATPLRTRMIGTPHLYRCLSAAAVGLGYGIDLMTVVRGLEAVDHVPGQLQRVECGQWFGVFVDRAPTPESLLESLQTLRALTEGRLICVFGSCGGREKEHGPQFAEIAESTADMVVLTGNDPLSGLGSPGCAKVVPDRAEAIAWALNEARQGDCVLIAGNGHETNRSAGGKRLKFDDCELARRWLYEHQPMGV